MSKVNPAAYPLNNQSRSVVPTSSQLSSGSSIALLCHLDASARRKMELMSLLRLEDPASN